MRLNYACCVVVFAVFAVVAGSLNAPAWEDSNKTLKIEGKWKWKYQSYRPEPASLAADPNNPTFVRWSPPGVVTIDEGGTTGKLEFMGIPPITLDLKLKVGTPAKLSISAVLNLPMGKKFTNELEGWFVPSKLGQEVGQDNPLVVRGSIVQTSEDIAPKDKNPQPKFTTGFFVLEPLK